MFCIYREDDKETAFSQYSSLQRKEEGDAKGCLDMGFIRREDLEMADQEIRSGSSLVYKGYTLWTDGEVRAAEIEETESPFPNLHEEVTSLGKSGDPVDQAISGTMRQIEEMFIAASNERILPETVRTFTQLAGQLSSLFPKKLRGVPEETIQCVLSLIREDTAV